MNSSLIKALVLVWANLLGAKSSGLPEKYAKLDKWLAENVVETARGKIFVDQAKEFLESMRGELNENEIGAVESVLKLEDIIYGPCDKQNAELMEHIAKDANIDTKIDAVQETSVQRIIWRYANRRARSCMREYNDKKQDLDSGLHLESSLISLMIGESFEQLGYGTNMYHVTHEQDSPQMNHIIATIESKDATNFLGKAIRNSWLKFGETEAKYDFKPRYNDKTGEKYVDKMAIASYLTKTFEFCNKFIKEYKEFLDLVTFDAKIGPHSHFVYESINNRIAKLRFCQAIIKRDRQEIVDEIVKQIMALN